MRALCGADLRPVGRRLDPRFPRRRPAALSQVIRSLSRHSMLRPPTPPHPNSPVSRDRAKY